MKSVAIILSLAAIAASCVVAQEAHAGQETVPEQNAAQSVSSAQNPPPKQIQVSLSLEVGNQTQTVSFPAPTEVDQIGGVLFEVFDALKVNPLSVTDKDRRVLHNKIIEQLDNPELALQTNIENAIAVIDIEYMQTQIQVPYFFEDGSVINAARSFLVRNNMDVSKNIVAVFTLLEQAVVEAVKPVVDFTVDDPLQVIQEDGKPGMLQISFPRYSLKNMAKYVQTALSNHFAMNNGTEAQLADAAFKIGQQAADAFNQKMEQAKLAQMQ